MNPPKQNPPHRGWAIALCVLLGAICAASSWADDLNSLSARLNDQSFALLTSISARHDSPNPLLGPVGVFAADSQKLSSAVAAGNRRGASLAIAALKSDAAEVDKAAAAGGLDSGRWGAIKHDLDALAAMIPAASPAAVAAASKSAPPASPPPARAPDESPRVRIESAESAGPGVVRVKGYMSGRALRSAGIYMGDTRVAKLNIKRVTGSQMIRFNLEIHDAMPGAELRVYDSAGRMARAPLMDSAQPLVESSPPTAPSPPPSLDSEENAASSGGDDLSADSAPEISAPEESTREIPAATPPPSRPKSRLRSHLRSRTPDDVNIRIDNVSVVDPGLREYMVRGQITGSDLERAGIYVDGRLVQRIALNSGSGSRTSSFAQSFATSGTEATIRVYRNRRDYTESSINLTNAGVGAEASGPVVINSTLGGYGALNTGQLAVQITSVQAAAPSLYVVSGIISGHNVVSAGIYQNGVLAQPLNIGGGISGGIGGLISGLVPGMTRQLSFTGRFNPAQGFATVRAYDSSGMMAEQPIMASGYPYGSSPYGANPYMRNPYSYGPGVGVAPGVGASPRSGAGAGLGSVPW